MATPPIEDVYAELRRIAAGYVRREKHQSVQATELVHEAYMRMANDANGRWNDRTHFLALAAIAMRRLLIEHARARGAAKRGGDVVRVTFNEALPVAGTNQDLDLIALDSALTRLESLEASHAKVVELRYFGGLTVEETADAMGISPATVKRYWTLAKAWLLRELEQGHA
ncbi:MAG: sigma-70 family RNA polymerase sigma factor [Acidobacteria bacterium]|jgi:RNA polymerase sigma factor (TIGR02999 family)|nr:sigma-70 family RNA polymerase sigma factor [Acidobacteriota bacterium]